MIIISADLDPEPLTVEVKTVKSEKHVSFVSNRVWGGLQSGNLFELNFLLEHAPLPDIITLQIQKDGTDKEISRVSSNMLIRENLATVYLNSDTLVALKMWLDAQVQQLKELDLIPEKK